MRRFNCHAGASAPVSGGGRRSLTEGRNQEVTGISWFRPSVSDLRPPPETGADAPAWQLNRRTRRYQAWPPSAATSPVAMGNEQDR